MTFKLQGEGFIPAESTGPLTSTNSNLDDDFMKDQESNKQ